MFSEIRWPEDDVSSDRTFPVLYELSESRYCEICGERLEEYEADCCVGMCLREWSLRGVGVESNRSCGG